MGPKITLKIKGQKLMMYMCFRPGYLGEYRPKLSEIECSSLKSNYEIEIDKNSMWKSKKTILD